MNNSCSLPGEWIFFFLHIVQYKYLKSCSEDCVLQDLILRTRLCGTSVISQDCWVADFRLINIVLYQSDTRSQRGKLAGLPLLTIFTWFIRSIWSHILGYHYRGGGGIFPKVKRLSRKCVGTLKRLISGFGLSCVGSQKRRNFLPRHIATSNHVCIFSPAHRLSESARKLVVRAILGVWPQFWC